MISKSGGKETLMDRFLTKLEDVLMLVGMLGALGVGTAQVIMRYIFNTGFVWSEIALVTLTILGALVGGSRAAAEGIHVRITVLTEKLPTSLNRYANTLALVIALAYSVFMAYAAFLYVQFLHMTGMISVEANIPTWIIFSIAPLTMILFALRYLQRVPRAWRGTDVVKVEFTD
jgi:C4-dicarboxylate transporter DctQ subunit